MRTKINKAASISLHFLHLIGVNKAVFFGVLSRVWFAVAGAVTVFLIAYYFTPELQGYYFTFSSLLALQIFVELGLATVIVNFTSHEWSKLELDKHGNIIGDSDALSRLRSLARIVFRWYLIGAVLLSVVLSAAGYAFFSFSKQTGIPWMSPWFSLCVVVGFNLSLLPIFALLEGSNQVSQIYFFRFIQEVVRSVSTWAIMVFGGGLWALAGSMFCVSIWAVIFLLRNYCNYFVSLFKHKMGPRISWREEIWPMQWRIAISWISGVFCFYLFVPVLFYNVGPVVAGQMGMTWAMANAISVIASMWIVTRAPQFGVLIAKKQHKELDRLFLHSGAVAVGIASLGAIVAYTFVSIVYALHHPFALRVLPPLPTIFFLIAAVLMQISIAQSTFLRAHKKEPFMGISVISAVLTIILTLYAGGKWGPIGIAVSYFSIVAFFGIPSGTVIWLRCKETWRREGVAEPTVLPDGNVIA